MSTYRGPHVEVTQRFQTNAPAIAVESLPSNAIGTAYDVYEKEAVGDVFGIIDNVVPWGADNVLFDESVAGKRAYDFYPANIFGDTVFGDVELSDVVKDVDGVTIGVDESYAVPGTDASLTGFLPYYKKITGIAGTVRILNTSLSTILITNGAVVSNKIKVGQKVFVTVNGGSSWTLVGTVGALTSAEGEVKLAVPYTAEITNGNGIVIGAASASTIDYVDTLYDPNVNFINAKVQIGDIVKFSSASIPGSESTPIEATVVGVFTNMLKFNTTVLPAGQIDYDVTKYKASTSIISSTVDLSSYQVDRLLGFSQNYGMKLIIPSVTTTAGPSPDHGVTVTRISDVKFSYPVAECPAMSIGDKFAITDVNPADGSEERDMANLRLYTVKSIIVNGDVFEVTTDSEIFQSVNSGEVNFGTGDYLTAWNPKITSTVKADFRSIRTEEVGVIKRISSVDDIVAAFSKDPEISIYNELAYMLQAVYARSGGKVCYGVHVSSKSADLLTGYTEALDALKMIDVYSTCLGTTDAGVNAIMGDYVNQQSEPYEAHERIAILSYDSDDIYKMGSDVADTTGGVLTISGSFNPISAGLTVGDTVRITKSNGDYVGEYNVIETPDAGLPTIITTDYNGVNLTGAAVVFMCGRKDAQAARISAIKYGNRRIKVLWPGYFVGDFGGNTITLPPYYIAAARCGMDGGLVASQSCTNFSFSLPGISNIQLGTNFYFKKEQLDVIGGGGVDITIQDTSLSQTIKSRHDLTSNMDAIEYREWSITKQADVSAKTYRAAVSPYVGKYNITDELIRFLSNVTNIATSVLVKQTIIKSAQLDSVAQDELVVDKVNIVITITVFVAGNYFDITLNVKSK